MHPPALHTPLQTRQRPRLGNKQCPKRHKNWSALKSQIREVAGIVAAAPAFRSDETGSPWGGGCPRPWSFQEEDRAALWTQGQSLGIDARVPPPILPLSLRVRE